VNGRDSTYAIFALLLAAGASGCDTLSGVTRRAELPSAPPEPCVLRALESIEGIGDIRQEVREGGRPITLSGIQEASTVHYYFYTYGGLRGNLYFHQDYKGRVELTQGYAYLNQPAPQEEIDLIYPVMRQVESRLQEECALPELEVEEYCMGVRCGF
jgi:hypothetical protein